MSTVKLNNYTKKIKQKIILDNINFEFKPGKIYGLYGRNGSGKTMLLRAIAGLIFPTEGTVIIDNKILHKDISFPQNLGIIIENTNLLPEYDGFTNLKILAKIRDVATDEDIKDAIKKVGLDPESKMKVNEYSLGMKQRLSIAQAIFENPDLLLLDEPTNALDEDSIQTVRNIFLEMNKKGVTIIIASHNKEDLKVLADETISMRDGQIIENKEAIIA